MATPTIRSNSSSPAQLAAPETQAQPDKTPVENIPKRPRGNAVMSALSSVKSTSSREPKKPQSEGLRVPQWNALGKLAMQKTRVFADGSTRTEQFHTTRAPSALTSPAGVVTNSFTLPEMVGKHGNPSWSDSHFHPTNYVQQGMTPDQMLEMMDDAGVNRSVLMPIPTDAAPCGNPDHNHIPQESYYVPTNDKDITREQMLDGGLERLAKKGHLILNQQVDADTAMFMNMAKLTDAQRDRLDPMITGLHLGSPLSAQALLYKLATHKGMFTGVGEVTIHKELVEKQYEGARQANLTDNVQSFKNILATAGVAGLPVVLHCDIDSLENQRTLAQQGKPLNAPEHLEGLRNLFTSPEAKDTTLIWAHFGGIGRFVAKPEEHHNNLLSIVNDPQMKHVSFDISWSRVAEQIVYKQDIKGNFQLDEHGKQIPDEKSIKAFADLINEHPTRFLFGSDALNPQATQTWTQTAELYKPLLDALKPETKAALFTGNYDRLITGARAKVRAFETHALTDTFVQEKLRASDGRVNEGPHIDPDALRAHRDAAFAAAGVDLNGNKLPSDV
ncbi:hypothetical protein NDK50_26700 [Paraburkholderia bryophila]|uniref:hypothetical protein n=1 Tax=Paraburkholderia bryophila TaxID=420952 RepID=UPI00234B9E14|nr:hypothetical protein [Paraburkholderia bryophila]WCM24405.1 hypothetical protein NDK50_26700 [Paraburkholderia bryophila]